MESTLIEWWLSHPLQTPFKIVQIGQLNLSDGPDVENVVLEIFGQQYWGPIEIDVKKSFWFRHGHYQHIRYKYTLLHLYNEDDGYEYLDGYVPIFSYNISSNKLQKNEVTNHVKFERIQNLLKHFSYEDVFWLLLARVLGYYYNRDQMMFHAYQYMNGVRDSVQTETSSRAVRPLNRFERRFSQFKILYQDRDLFHRCIDIINQRLELQYCINSLHYLFNSQLPYGMNLSKDRLTQFFTYYLLPLIIAKQPTQHWSMVQYLRDIYDQCSDLGIIKKYA